MLDLSVNLWDATQSILLSTSTGNLKLVIVSLFLNFIFGIPSCVYSVLVLLYFHSKLILSTTRMLPLNKRLPEQQEMDSRPFLQPSNSSCLLCHTRLFSLGDFTNGCDIHAHPNRANKQPTECAHRSAILVAISVSIKYQRIVSTGV